MTEPRVDPRTRDLAVHGSFCPKLCSHTCPVLAATGRDEAVPWALHRVVADIATGRAEPTAGAGTALGNCTGCGACATACDWDDQDVPAQVRAGRAAVVAAGAGGPAVEAAAVAVADGRRPDGSEVPEVDEGPGQADVTIVAGCRDRVDTIEALRRIVRASGTDPRVVLPAGCCGSRLDDIGAVSAAIERRNLLQAALAGPHPTRVVVLDPHCLPSVRAVRGGDVSDAVTFVAGLATGGLLPLQPSAGPVVWHDPCLLARGEGVVAAPRHLLGTLGREVVEPEGHGTATVCSGAGMGFELLDADASEAVADRRAAMLRHEDIPVITGCAGASTRLAAVGLAVQDLFEFVDDHLEGDA